MLRSGKEYNAQHVQWLAKQIPGLVCLSDVPVDGVETIPLKHGWGGWWSKMELFRPDISGDLLYFDLDTVVLGDVSCLETGQTTVLRDFYKPHTIGSGLMYLAEADRPKVWQNWMTNTKKHMAACRSPLMWGDQGFLSTCLKAKRWQDVLPGTVVSYKANCRAGVPAGAVVVCFHGHPRPWQVNHSWIPNMQSGSRRDNA